MKRLYLYLYLVLLLGTVACSAANQRALFDSATTAYGKSRFEDAIKYYEQIASLGYESDAVYFNLGNAYFKQNNLPYAILNYEKAKKIAPEDEAISYNLKLANSKLVDKVDVLPEFFLKTWWNLLIGLFSEKTWSIVFIGFVWFGLIGLSLLFLSHKRSVKKIGFLVGLIALCLSPIFGYLAHKRYQQRYLHSEGIVLGPSVTIKGSPSDQGTDLFILHEGIKVGIDQTFGDWIEIKLPNGNPGWIKSVNLGVI